MTQERWTLKATVGAHHRFLRLGAKVVLFNRNPGNGAAQVEVRGLSRGGRMVQTWLNPNKYLVNWRPEFIAEAGGRWIDYWPTKQEAQDVADVYNSCRVIGTCQNCNAKGTVKARDVDGDYIDVPCHACGGRK